MRDRESLERCNRLHGPLQRMPTWVKALATLLLLVGAAFDRSPTPVHLGVFYAFLAAAVAVSRIPPLLLLRRLLWFEPMVLGVACLALFGHGGVRGFLLLVARSTGCVIALLLLSGTTPFTELLALLKRLRVPSLLVTTIALMYRYLFVLADEAGRMRRARASRTFTTSRRLAWRTRSSVAAQLFVRASDRAGRVWAAMCARGWS